MKKKTTIEDARISAKKRNGKCLSNECTNTYTKLKWQCEKGHTWFATLGNVRRGISSGSEYGTWCKECGAILRRNTIEECQMLAKNKNGKCLTSEYKNQITKMEWQCEKGHTWFAISHSIKNGGWCPQCNIDGQKSTIEECRSLAERKEGKCLSKTYISSHTSIKWECRYGHIWSATRGNIWAGKWCPYCAGKYITIQDAQLFAKSSGGKCLSKVFTRNSDKMEWQCNKGHVWEASFGNIKAGKWCPQCSSGKTQRKLVKIIKDILPCNSTVNVNYKDLDWLYNKKTKKKQEIDIYVPSLKLAIEYDGQQHFFPVCFGGMDKEEAKRRFKRTKYNDRRKNRLMKKHPKDVEYFIRFNYKEKLTKGYVLEKLIKNGIPINNDQNNQKQCAM